VPVQRFVDDWPRIEPTRQARKAFTWGAVGSCVLAGYIFAKLTVNQSIMQNPWYNRPDLKPYPAMVAENKTRDITLDTMKTTLYGAEKRKQNAIDRKRSAWYRYFFTLDADFEVKENPYAHYHKTDIFNSKSVTYSSYTNDFPEHLQR
jgi:hypothetical protein